MFGVTMFCGMLCSFVFVNFVLVPLYGLQWSLPFMMMVEKSILKKFLDIVGNDTQNKKNSGTKWTMLHMLNDLMIITMCSVCALENWSAFLLFQVMNTFSLLFTSIRY